MGPIGAAGSTFKCGFHKLDYLHPQQGSAAGNACPLLLMLIAAAKLGQAGRWQPRACQSHKSCSKGCKGNNPSLAAVPCLLRWSADNNAALRFPAACRICPRAGKSRLQRYQKLAPICGAGAPQQHMQAVAEQSAGTSSQAGASLGATTCR